MSTLPVAQQTADGFAKVLTSIKNYEIPMASAVGPNLAAVQQIAPNVKAIDFNFFGINLAAMPNFKILNALWIIPILSGATAFGYSWMAKKYQPAAATQNAQAASMNNTMTYIMPFFSVYIAFVVPAGLGLYWIASNVIMMIQEPVLNWYFTKDKKNGEITSKEAKS